MGAMLYAAAVVERAMKMQEVILRVLSGALTWLQAADIGLDEISIAAALLHDAVEDTEITLDDVEAAMQQRSAA